MIALYLDAKLGAGSEEHIFFFKLTTGMSFEVQPSPTKNTCDCEHRLPIKFIHGEEELQGSSENVTTFSLILGHNLNALTAETERR